MANSSTRAKSKWLEQNYKRVQVRIEKDLVEEFDQVVKITGDSKASVIREAIKQYIERNKECWKWKKKK